MTVTAAD